MTEFSDFWFQKVRQEGIEPPTPGFLLPLQSHALPLSYCLFSFIKHTVEPNNFTFLAQKNWEEPQNWFLRAIIILVITFDLMKLRKKEDQINVSHTSSDLITKNKAKIRRFKNDGFSWILSIFVAKLEIFRIDLKLKVRDCVNFLRSNMPSLKS